MNSIQPNAAPLSVTQGRTPLGSRKPTPPPSAAEVQGAEKVREAFRGFVGATVFGQMLGSMRGTVGEPAYFHGGQAEKVFQSQLDQEIADQMTAKGGSAFADSLFEHQFPHRADVLRRAQSAGKHNASADHGSAAADTLEELSNLRRS